MEDVQAEIASIMANPDYTNDDVTVRGPLVDQVMQLRLQAEDPEATHPAMMPKFKHDVAVGDGMDARSEDFLVAPALPEDISFQALELPDGFEEDAAEIEQCREWLYSAEIPQATIDGVIKTYARFLTLTESQIEAEGRAARESLMQRYGDNFERALHLAASAAHSIGGEELLHYLDVSGLGNDFSTIKAFVDLAERKGHLVNAN